MYPFSIRRFKLQLYTITGLKVFSDRKLKWIVRRMTQPIILFGSLNNGLVTWDGPDVLFGSPNIKIHRTHSQIPRQSKASRSCTNLKTRSRSAFPWANSVNNCPSKSPRSSILYPFVLPSPLSLLHPITYTEIEAFRFSTQNCLTLAPHTNRPSTLYTFTSSRLCNPKVIQDAHALIFRFSSRLEAIFFLHRFFIILFKSENFIDHFFIKLSKKTGSRFQ